ncbi:hypothetical protein FQA39_LY16468 [Lamprigera yunnana]|nr:hypothetical protein FQA39_LY16468 [Lamprigera yunnana]
MLASEVLESEGLDDDFNMVLASDYNWRIKIYFKLLKRIRDNQHGMVTPWPEEVEPVQLHHWNILPKTCCNTREKLEVSKKKSLSKPGPAPGPITWSISDIAKAAALLNVPPKLVDFEDEQEMRRVYSLIFDTYRYKGVLNQALNDISFFQLHTALKKVSTHVWLLFFDLYHRSFKKRDTSDLKTATKLFESAGILNVENVLWTQRIKLAAAVARLRIKNSALNLNDLLPKHLRNERCSDASGKYPVTCWINSNRIKNDDEIIMALEKALCLTHIDIDANLSPNSYKYDHLCPNFLTFHHSLRAVLARSFLVQKHKLIVQDRSFCLGPATFGKIINELELTGTVIQSHVNSPRTTAYLAMLLSKNSKINKLLVFGAGSRKEEYSKYLEEIGVTNVSVYSEKLTEIPPQSNFLEEVMAVFATPPNSYSAINDPLDLVCSRGGDLSMLEVLTESEITEEGRERVTGILDEQRKTLKYAMSRPQIQLVLYETHSELSIENQDMVQKTMKDINKLTTLKHAALQGKLRVDPIYSDMLLEEINNNETIKIEIFPSEDSSRNSCKTPSIRSCSSHETFNNFYHDVNIPNCDLFDIPALPKLCINADDCLNLSNEGCYLALIQRKEVTKLNDKYMIEMAETRGLFGNSSTTTTRTKGSRSSKAKKQEKRAASPPLTRNKRKPKQIQIERIAAPTEASSIKQFQAVPSEGQPCRKVKKEEDKTNSKVPQSRRWWTETTQHLTNLRQSLIHQNILPNIKKASSQPFFKTLKRSFKIDEIVAKSSENNKIPVFPRLRLTRNIHKYQKRMEYFEDVCKDVSIISKKMESYKTTSNKDVCEIMEITRKEHYQKTQKEKSKVKDKQFFHILKQLTRSNEQLKQIVSSRIPYRWFKNNNPLYKYRSCERNMSSTRLSIDENGKEKNFKQINQSPKDKRIKLTVISPLFFKNDQKKKKVMQ